MNSVYESLSSFDGKENFVKKMGNYAEFYKKWLKYDGKDNSTFPGIGSSEDADMASMLILFLKDSKHKMAITMLGSLYESVIENGTAAKDDFINVVKAVAAYYFLWRSAFSNSGLDSTYREFFKKNKDFTVDTVKLYLRDVLKQRGIDALVSWKSKALNYLKYDSTGKDVLRLALLIAAHDTIPDENNKGLVKIGRSGCSKYLAVSKWLSPDLKTIEHIAPQTNKEKAWDESLYDTHIEPFQSLGNLTLLPQDLNSSAGNKGWKEKLLYYQSVAEKDPAKINDIESRASALGISLNSSTIELLKESHFNEHLASISLMSAEDSWDKELVERRTDRMLDIIWERVTKWIL